MSHDLAVADLRQFTGTEKWYRHWAVRDVLYTDGVQYVAEHGGAYWLLDEIALAQKSVDAVKAEPFQVWTLTRHAEGSGASLTVEDGNGRTIYAKEIEFTDFPLPQIALWYTNNVILLPYEY